MALKQRSIDLAATIMSRSVLLVLSAATLLSAFELSGHILNPDHTGKGGVTVKLASTGTTATTNVDGTWALSGGTGVKQRGATGKLVTGHLILDGVRLSLSYSGYNLSGRSQLVSEAATPHCQTATRSAGISVDTLIYSYGGKTFLRDTVSESRSSMARIYNTTWNASIIYGYVTDTRDGQVYRTVMIGTQTWMAQNINYSASGSIGVCPGKNGDSTEGAEESCTKYGRLYTWKEAMQGADASFADWNGPKGLCPTGYHVPSDAEWTTLEKSADPTRSNSAVKLKSKSGWHQYDIEKDDYGFRALPAGMRFKNDGTFLNVGELGGWWTSKEYDANYALSRYMRLISQNVITYDSEDKTSRASLRCVKD